MPSFLLKDVHVIAVVGVSRNPEKWGHRVFKELLERYPHMRIYPINPKADSILGHKAYPSISSLPEKPDLVITVVPPQITESVVEEAIRLGVKYIWMQPGSESQKAIEVAESSGIRVIHHACIVESSKAEKITYFKIKIGEDQ